MAMELLVTLVSCKKLPGFFNRIVKITFRNESTYTSLYEDCTDIYFREVYRFPLQQPLGKGEFINIQVFNRNKIFPDRYLKL
ncbi:hypothetical protein HZS_4392 [Henneguya salminicola]|nr:hypothetical protein HZS_4392 [Henneguya salminicola]